MLELGEGMTKIYNRVSDPDEQSHGIRRLRDLHVALDFAAASAYGWRDIDFDHGIHEHIRFEPRWLPAPQAQREIEKRLAALNQQRVPA
jgi:hypothetical protein